MNDQIYHASIEARERGERLRRIRNLANLSRKTLCEEAEININTYIGYEVGRYGGLTKKGADRVITYLTSKGVYCSLDWLMQGEGKAPKVITESTAPTSFLESETLKMAEELQLFHSHYKNSIDYQIIDDGMLPLYEIGSYVAGVACSEVNIKKVVGFDCIVKTKSGELIVRNVREGRIENTYTLTCINPETSVNSPILYDVKLSFAAKIIWHRKIHKTYDDASNLT